MLSARGYWILLLSVFLGLTLVKGLSDRAVQLSCWAGGYTQDAWMAYCNSKRYGVYDIEAIWHGVEAEAVPAIMAARVLTLSDSRLQNALSLGGASQWFTSHHYPLYMLGLPAEESGFAEQFVDRFHPHPNVVIFDTSPYFTGSVGVLETPIFADEQASRAQVMELKAFQERHRRFCARWSWACGHNFSYFRSRVDGHWIFPGSSKQVWIGGNSVPNDVRRFRTTRKANEGLPLYPKYLAQAKRLVDKLGIPPSCVVITNVPSDEDLRGLAEYIGAGLGLTVIDPQVPDLYTFDLAHLTPASSEAWTRAFLEQLEPVLRRCVSNDATPVASLH